MALIIRWTVLCFMFQQLFFSDSVTLFRTAVEGVISEVQLLLRTGEVTTTLPSIVLAMANDLFGLYGSERRDELFIAHALEYSWVPRP